MLKKVLLAAAFLTCKSVYAQSPESLLENIRKNYTSEKIFIHYDKAAYLSGETIWFKAYLAEGMFPSPESTVLNVELINDSGKVVQKKILPVIASFAAGNFDLPVSAPGGSYTVKAYTRRMMNFGTENFYYYSLNIYRPGAVHQATSEENTARIYFLPEGGNLVGNLRNTVAFKCNDSLGYPVEARGKITDAAGKEIVSFATTHDGMGSFNFTPLPGEKYTAQYIAGNAEQMSKLLPVASYDGITLSVKRRSDTSFFEIQRSSTDNSAFTPAYLLGVEENAMVFKTPLPAGGKTIRGVIPVDQLPTGILQLTVFNSGDKPLAERLVFVNSGDYILEGNLINQKKGLNTRGENSFYFETTDTSLTTYSVAVTDADNADIDSSQADDIVSRFLLSAELKGRIVHPAYYFESTDDEHSDNLDLVMLTNGWRRYSWNEIFTGRFPSMSFKDMNYLSVSGTAYDPVMNKPLSDAELSLFVRTKDNQSDFQLLKTDVQGNFLTSPMWFEDSAKFSFQNNKGKHGKVNIVLTTPPLVNSTYVVQGHLPHAATPVVSEMQAEKINNNSGILKTNSGGILLDMVRIKSKAKSAAEKYAQKYISGTLGSNADHTLDFLADPPKADGSNILEYLKSKLPGVDIIGGPFNYTINYHHMMSLQGGMIPMSVFLDEVEVEPDIVSSIPVSQIALVKVFSVSAMSGTGGALAIYTKKGEDGYVSSLYSELNIFKVEGFSPTKEYFSPDYSPGKESDVLKDERTTLYWDPYLSTDARHPRISFSFFNSDRAKRIKVIINGMTADGKLLYIEKILE